MCLSLSLDSLTDVVLKNFLVGRPYPYALHIAFESSKLGKALKKYEEKQWSSDPWSILNLKVGSKSVMSLYKHPKTSEDIYFKLAQLTNQNVRTETWLRPPGNPMKSNCDHPGTEVENIKRVQLTFQHRKLEASFKSYKDHSKWAVSRVSGYGCVGDLNRAESQTHRGGGVTCIMDSNVWNLFFEITQLVEKCPDDKDPP
ncbi:hypothetical protein NH340_JMT03534 [Sarcoptes scabiei]|nr:hypothetical protein NH340_JMT03534 [Sarcoptes scabiei]